MAVKKILLLEDDPGQADWIATEVVWPSFPNADIKYFDSEYSFISAVAEGEIQQWKPNYAVCDLLFRYYSVKDLAELGESARVKDIPESIDGGVRCLKLLRESCGEVPSALMTVLNIVPDGFLVLQKGAEDFSQRLRSFFK